MTGKLGLQISRFFQHRNVLSQTSFTGMCSWSVSASVAQLSHVKRSIYCDLLKEMDVTKNTCLIIFFCCWVKVVFLNGKAVVYLNIKMIF